jgi:hypothetical protein
MNASFSLPLQIVVGGVAGSVAGAAYFGALAANARCYVRRAIAIAIVMQAVRFAMLSLLLYGLARLGAMTLLSAVAALVVVRNVALRLWRPAT